MKYLIALIVLITVKYSYGQVIESDSNSIATGYLTKLASFKEKDGVLVVQYIKNRMSKSLHDYIEQKNIQEIILVSLIVDENGKVSDVEVKNSPSKLLEVEIIEILSYTEWMPAENKEIPIKTRVSFPMKL